jgi:cytochrome c peroxidase
MTGRSRESVTWRKSAPFAAALLGAGAVLLAMRSASSAFDRPATPSFAASEGHAAPATASTEAVRPSESAPPNEPPSAASASAASPQRDDARSALGRKIFFDTNLSQPPGTSCASCHDPARAFAGNHGSTLGVALGSRPGHYAKRNTPSVLYLRFEHKFHLHWEEDAPLVDAYGGFFWDGRTDSITELARQPLLNPDEMNGGSAPRVAQVIASSAYAADFRAEFGDALDHPDAVLDAVGQAVDTFLKSVEMSPFSSRYDDYVRGRGELTALESQGLKLFKDSAKGGCSACHKMNDRSSDPSASLFTDNGFDAVAVPRNRLLPRTRDPKYFDLGLCERRGDDYKEKTEEFCGRFRTPSLRNVAVRRNFMHNGAFSSLREVVEFYATRGITPRRWYKSGVAFDDLPEAYRPNVNVDKAPYNRHEGETPPLDAGEIDAIVAFLGTLTDAQFR